MCYLSGTSLGALRPWAGIVWRVLVTVLHTTFFCLFTAGDVVEASTCGQPSWIVVLFPSFTCSHGACTFIVSDLNYNFFSSLGVSCVVLVLEDFAFSCAVMLYTASCGPTISSCVTAANVCLGFQLAKREGMG